MKFPTMTNSFGLVALVSHLLLCRFWTEPQLSSLGFSNCS